MQALTLDELLLLISDRRGWIREAVLAFRGHHNQRARGARHFVLSF